MISKFHFLRTFRRVTGVTPGRFLSAVRIHEAKHLLSTTGLSVAEISVQVGYGSLGTFTRRFTECVGLSPTAYRRVAQGAPIPEDSGARATVDRPGGSLSGTIQATLGVISPVFVGLFDSPIPRGRPITWTVLPAPGPWELLDVPSGSWHLLAAAADPRAADLATSELLTGLSEQIRVIPGRHVQVDVTIRPPDWRYPPLLSVLPGIERQRLAA